ncbi:CopM family metallochaperone [Caballeronia grimmiae]|uniref:CopM family metallochaperone n=1 Tax=Caballeronia grimmiae TaxID=1071679 RepID=UPI0038B94E0E
MKPTSALLAVFTAFCSATAIAQTALPAHGDMPGMHAEQSAASDTDLPSTAAFQAADQSMMSAMSDIEYTGDADRDFVAHTIPHHRGAVAMAKIELKYGKDAKLRKLAKDIIAAQDKEIAFMNQWLAAHPAKK